MYQYRELELREAARIAEIDAAHFVKNVWRKDASGEYRLVEINWTDPNCPTVSVGICDALGKLWKMAA